MHSRSVVGLVVVIALAWSPVAGAESSSRSRAEAQTFFERGVELVDQDRWEEALVAFDQSLRLYPTQTALYNRALCLEALGRPLDAIRALEEHRRQYGSTVDPERRAQVDEVFGRLQQRVGRIGIEVLDADAATVLLDGRELGPAPILEPIVVDPGEHVVTARLASGQEVTRSVAVGPGAVTPVVLSFAAGAAQPGEGAAPADAGEGVEQGGTVEAPPQASAERRPGRGLRIGGFVAAGLAVAALGTALGLYLWNDSEADRWSEQNDLLGRQLADGSLQLGDQQIADNDELSDRIQAVDAASWALLAVGAAGAAAAVALLVLGYGRRSSDSGSVEALLLPGPGGLSLTAWF